MKMLCTPRALVKSQTLTATRVLLALALVFSSIAFFLPVKPSFADLSPAQRYLHLRNSIQDALLPESRLAAIQSNPDSYYGQVVEASGRIVGGATTSGSRMLILQVGSTSVDVSVPQALSDISSWLDTGNVVRVLVQAPPKNDTSNMLRLIAAAPESDVDQLERQIAISSAPRHRTAKRYGRAGGYETGRAAVFTYRGPVEGTAPDGLPNAVDAVRPYYRDAIGKLNRHLSSSEADTIATSILYYSYEEKIDPRLIVAMIIAESGFDPNATSRTGAMGLGQLEPGTAAGLGVTNAYDPVQNIAAAVHILSGNADKYGGKLPNGIVPLNTLLLTMAAYNAGSGAVHKYHGIPPYRETQRYVRKVAELYHQLAPDAVLAAQ